MSSSDNTPSSVFFQEYQERIREEIEKEQERKDLLLKRVKQLENQIDTLIQDSLGLLKVFPSGLPWPTLAFVLEFFRSSSAFIRNL